MTCLPWLDTLTTGLPQPPTWNEVDLKESISRFWEMESVEEERELKNEDELFYENHFKNTFSTDETGRYVVDIPFKEDISKLGKSKETAWRRLNALWHRLYRNPQLCSLYQKFMQQYEQLGHMTKVEEDIEPNTTYYIPHNGVYCPEKSSAKLRVVFNASCPTSNGRSLNSLQANGGMIQDELFSIIIRFRKQPIAITADIEKMYEITLITPSQKNYLRIPWKSDKNYPISTYRLNTVAYGTTSIPFLATRTLKQIAIYNREKFPEAEEILETDFYVDDLVSGASNIAIGKEIQKQLIELLSCAGIKLHEWSSNSKDMLQELPYMEPRISFFIETKKK
ncbi:integrase catalytic domain-containing protein [Trichonephila clavipes]|nr:integrase catalytic domain-containing protein [Trichonephila clavipes]